MAKQFSLKRAPGFGYQSFATVMLLGRRGTVEIDNTKAGRKAFADIARWAYKLEKEIGLPFRLVPHELPEIPHDRDPSMPEKAEIGVALGRFIGSCPYRQGPVKIAAYLDEYLDEVDAVPDAVWSEAEERLGTTLGLKQGSRTLTRANGRILVPAGVGIMATYIVGVESDQEPKKRRVERNGPHLVENWHGVYGHVWARDGIAEIDVDDADLKRYADEVRDMGQPFTWLGSVRI